MLQIQYLQNQPNDDSTNTNEGCYLQLDLQLLDLKKTQYLYEMNRTKTKNRTILSSEHILQFDIIFIGYASNLILHLQVGRMDHQSELPLGFFNFKYSDKNSDILSLHQSSSITDNYVKKVEQVQNNSFVQSQLSQQLVQQYFNLLFSPKAVTESLIRRNQYLQMKCIQNEQSSPEEMYNKRKKRVSNLKEKQSKNWLILSSIKQSDPNKYVKICQIMKLFGDIKLKLNGIRHDYYSQKTFLTLKKASTEEIAKAILILSGMFKDIMQNYRNQVMRGVDQRYIQFLIIPRFFISKEKLVRFLNDEVMQRNFKFLIYHGCLGHYNNEANKKLPQQNQMKYVRVLLEQRDGKERFKKICTINHGGNFFKRHQELYYELFFKSLDCLKKVDQMCKKKYNFDELIQYLSKQQNKFISQCEDINLIQHFQDAKINWNFDKNSLKSVSSFLNSFVKQQAPQRQTNMSSSYQIQVSCPQKGPSKCKLRRPNSLMQNPEIQRKSTFRLKKSQTLELGRQTNIILIHPPSQTDEMVDQNI